MIFTWIKTYINKIILGILASVIAYLGVTIFILNAKLVSKDKDIQSLVSAKTSIESRLKQAQDETESRIFEAKNECAQKNAQSDIDKVTGDTDLIPEGEYTL